ncbi:hypothetical protein Tco_0328715 [Tanacetum coccineum]
MGGILEKDSAPHLTARQEKTVKLLESHKAPFRRYPECFLCLVGLSPYYPFDALIRLLKMGLFDFIKTADPRKVQVVEVQKGYDQVSALTEEGQEDVAPEEAYLELVDPDEDTTAVRQSEKEVVTEQSDVLPAKKLRVYHPTLVSGTGGKTLAGLEHIRLAGSHLSDLEQLAFHPVAPSSQGNEGFLDSSAQTNLRICNIMESSSTLGIPVDTTAGATTFTKAAMTTSFATGVNPDLAGPSQSEESEGSDDSFYEPPTFDPSEVKRWAVRQVCLRAEVRSRAEHELKLKEKLKAKYSARGRLLKEKDLEILRLKSQLAEKEAEAAELKVTVTQKDHDISLLDSRAACLASILDDAKVAYPRPRTRLLPWRLSEIGSPLRYQEEQAQELFNRVAEIEAYVMNVFGRLEGEFYPAYLTTLAGKRWLLTYGIQLALLKCLKSPEYQGILGHALGRAVDFGMQEGLEAGYEHGVAGRNLSVVDAYNPEVAKASYINAVKALEDVDFPLVNLLKSKKDAGMDEVLDCFLLDGPLAGLPEAAYLQPCIEQLSIPIHHAGDNTAVGETSLSFALMNVHARAEGAKKHAAALRQLMMEIVSAPLSSQTWVGEASTSVAPLSVEDYDEEDTDEALGSVVAVPKLETCRF